MSRYRSVVIAAAVLAVVLVGIVLAAAVAQPRRSGAGPGMGGPPPMSPAIAATADTVFVVAAHRVYKFDADTLQLVADAEIPRPAPPARPAP